VPLSQALIESFQTETLHDEAIGTKFSARIVKSSMKSKDQAKQNQPAGTGADGAGKKRGKEKNEIPVSNDPDAGGRQNSSQNDTKKGGRRSNRSMDA
jgi:hypothetical protein